MVYFAGKIFGDPKPEKVVKAKVQYKYKRKNTGEKELFLEIWSERPHFCQRCFTPIPEPSPIHFAHVLAKGFNKYPKFKLEKFNILLFCPDCHHIWDYARHKASSTDWQWVHKLEAKLKEDYKRL